MRLLSLVALLLLPASGRAADSTVLGERARDYLIDLIRLDTTNPPGNETRVAEYLKRVVEQEGIACELMGGDPKRLNFIARLPGTGRRRPVMLMAHSDVVPADRKQWSVNPFAGTIRDGYVFGRGAQDCKGLLAAELAVLVELKRKRVRLDRDVILLSESDEEAGSGGVRWLIENAWNKIDAEFALNEGGSARITPGPHLFQIQTAEKIPTRAILTAHGTAGHGSLPRPDNPVVRLSVAVAKVAQADQPVRLNTTTRRYFTTLSKLDGYQWLAPLVPKLSNSEAAIAAANQIRSRDPELDPQLRTSISPTMLSAGLKVNVIPNSAEAQLDIRRLPNETREEIMERLRRIINDNSVDVTETGQVMPATEPSSITSPLYKAMEEVFSKTGRDAVALPFMQRGATDGSHLRHKGMAVYGVPLFLREEGESRAHGAHGNDERTSVQTLDHGANLLLQIVLTVSQ